MVVVGKRGAAANTRRGRKGSELEENASIPDLITSPVGRRRRLPDWQEACASAPSAGRVPAMGVAIEAGLPGDDQVERSARVCRSVLKCRRSCDCIRPDSATSRFALTSPDQAGPARALFKNLSPPASLFPLHPDESSSRRPLRREGRPIPSNNQSTSPITGSSYCHLRHPPTSSARLITMPHSAYHPDSCRSRPDSRPHVFRPSLKRKPDHARPQEKRSRPNTTPVGLVSSHAA